MCVIRMIIAYHLGLTGKAADAARALAQAVAIRQAEWVEPPVIRTHGQRAPVYCADV